MMPNISTARANDRSQLVSLKFMMPRSVSGPSERSCFAAAAPMERAYLDYSRLRCSKPDTGAANAFAALVGVAQSILKRFQPELPPGPFFCPWNRFGPRLAVRDSGPAKAFQRVRF